MTSLFRLLLVGVFLYILIRIVQVVMRIMSSGPGRTDAPEGKHAPLDIKEPERFEDIRDAEFTDIPPSKQPKGKPGEGGPSPS
jgi:hypothetical protein